MDDIEQIIDNHHRSGIKIFFIDSLQNFLIGKLDSTYANNAEQVLTANCKRLINIIREINN